MKPFSYLIAFLITGFTAVTGIHRWAAPSLMADPQSGEVKRYVGAEVCTICHIDFARKWANLDHSKKLMAYDKVAKGLRGCEGCHGPGEQHVLGNRKSIVTWDGLSNSQRAGICLQCHQGKVAADQWNSGPHASHDLTCTICHEVHQPMKQEKMLRKPENDLCLGCHANISQEADAKTHHTLAKGEVTCANCHNPHGSKNPTLLVATKAKLCAACHGEDVPKPDTHNAKDWSRKHGAASKTQMKQCLMCHDQKDSCNKCHGGLEMPHPAEWTEKKHKLVASFKDDSNCWKCHKKDFCQQCHN